LRRKLDAVNVVAPVGRQRHAADGFSRLRARFTELASETADLHHWARGRKREHNAHGHQRTESVADVVGVKFLEALGAVAALQEESSAGRHFGELGFKVARFARKHERRVSAQLMLSARERAGIWIIRR